MLDVDQDSRSIGPGALLAARHGGKTDGPRFVADAVRRGVVAVMVDEGAMVPELACPLLRVRDVRARCPSQRRPCTLSEPGAPAGGRHRHQRQDDRPPGSMQRVLDGDRSSAARASVRSASRWRAQGRQASLTHARRQTPDLAEPGAGCAGLGASYAAMEVSSTRLASPSRRGAAAFEVAAFTT